MLPLGLLLSGLLLAVPVLAGTAYVPFVAAEPPTNAFRATAVQFSVINLGTVPRLGSVHFVAAGEDGNAGGTALLSRRMEPGPSVLQTCCDGISGLLILSGAPQVAYRVYLVEEFPPATDLLALRLPLITDRDALPAGSRGRLFGLVGAGGGMVATSFGILNLGHQPAHCSVAGFPEYVEQLVRTVVVPPVSVAGFPDLFGQPTFGAHADPVVICDQPFYPFALIYRGLPGKPFGIPGLPWVELVPPSVPLGTVP